MKREIKVKTQEFWHRQLGGWGTFTVIGSTAAFKGLQKADVSGLRCPCNFEMDLYYWHLDIRFRSDVQVRELSYRHNLRLVRS